MGCGNLMMTDDRQPMEIWELEFKSEGGGKGGLREKEWFVKNVSNC